MSIEQTLGTKKTSLNEEPRRNVDFGYVPRRVDRSMSKEQPQTLGTKKAGPLV